MRTRKANSTSGAKSASGARRAGKSRRHFRIRKRVTGTSVRPRLVVHRSSRHIHVQVVDDTVGRTLVAASTLDATIRSKTDAGDKKAKAGLVGTLVAERAKAAGIDKVVFDRGGNTYTGRIAALADAARAGGLEF